MMPILLEEPIKWIEQPPTRKSWKVEFDGIEFTLCYRPSVLFSEQDYYVVMRPGKGICSFLDEYKIPAHAIRMHTWPDDVSMDSSGNLRYFGENIPQNRLPGTETLKEFIRIENMRIQRLMSYGMGREHVLALNELSEERMINFIGANRSYYGISYIECEIFKEYKRLICEEEIVDISEKHEQRRKFLNNCDLEMSVVWDKGRWKSDYIEKKIDVSDLRSVVEGKLNDNEKEVLGNEKEIRIVVDRKYIIVDGVGLMVEIMHYPRCLAIGRNFAMSRTYYVFMTDPSSGKDKDKIWPINFDSKGLSFYCDDLAKSINLLTFELLAGETIEALSLDAYRGIIYEMNQVLTLRENTQASNITRREAKSLAPCNVKNILHGLNKSIDGKRLSAFGFYGKL